MVFKRIQALLEELDQMIFPKEIMMMMIINNIILKPKYMLSFRCEKKKVFIYYNLTLSCSRAQILMMAVENIVSSSLIEISSVRFLTSFKKIHSFLQFPKVMCGDIVEHKNTQGSGVGSCCFLCCSPNSHWPMWRRPHSCLDSRCPQ